MKNSKNQGWVRLHRQIEENPLWFLEKFTKAQAWIDLFLNANHKDNFIEIRGNIVPIKRGQIGWSELTMMKRWRWSKNKVRRFLKLLESEQQITQQKYKYITTIITILNYEKFQNDTPNDTAEGQQKDSRRYINKKVKNVKNEKNIIVKNSPEALKLAKLLYKLIKENNPAWYVKPNWNKWSEDIDKINRLDNRTYKQIEWMIRWCQQDPFWSQNILSPSKLRQKFNQLVVKSKGSQKKVAVIS